MGSHLVLATTASAVPMGAQHYQEAVAERAQSSLDAVEPGWRVTRSVARSLRSPLPGTLRMPMGRLVGAGRRERAAWGRLLYPKDAVVHRMDLVLPPPAGPDVVTLHDVVSWKYPDESAPIRAAATELRAADAVICVSQFTADEAGALLGLRDPIVVPNGVDQRFFDAAPLSEEALRGFGIDGRYVLYSGGSSARKNLPGLAEAWRLLAAHLPDVSLVLAGPPSPVRDELFGALPRVVQPGRVADDVLTGLLAGASVAVVPSLHEGFGLPALEAMAAGTPLVSSDRASLPEVVGDGGLLTSPEGTALAAAMEATLGGGQEVDARVARGRARAAAYTWERTVEGHAEVWRRLAGD